MGESRIIGGGGMIPKFRGFRTKTEEWVEGNLIYPFVAGKASGLPSIWILVAVTLGGSLMGVLGIILFIPLFSIIYTLLGEYVNFRLKEKKIL